MSNPEQTITPDLGGLVIENGASAGGAASAQDLPNSASASERTIRERKKRADAGQPRGPRTRTGEPSVPAISIPPALFAKLYEPAIWARALAAPADTMAAITGHKHWELSVEEKEHLGVTGSLAAQMFAVSDPRGLALAICAITVLDVYGVRLLMELDARKKEREAEKKKRQELHGG